MNTRRVDAAAGVLHAAMQLGKSLPAALAYDLEAAGLLQSPETAAELLALRARVAELEAEQGRPAPVLKQTAELERIRADHYKDAARLLKATGSDDDAVNLLDLMADGIREYAMEQAQHEGPEHHTYRLGRDLPETPHA